MGVPEGFQQAVQHFVEITPPLYWRAIYQDGTVLDQYNSFGFKTAYDDLPRKGLVKFMLLTKSKTPVITLHLDKDKVLFRRTRATLHLKSGTRTRAHIIGWRQKKNKMLVCIVLPDGSIEVRDSFVENDPWFYSILFREAERL